MPVRNLGPYDHPAHQTLKALYTMICAKIEPPDINKKFLSLLLDKFEILKYPAIEKSIMGVKMNKPRLGLTSNPINLVIISGLKLKAAAVPAYPPNMLLK
jgi:hypothetical protein